MTPIRPTGDIRICMDCKGTISKAFQDCTYPVPVVSYVLATLAGAKVFGKLDLAQEYQQLPVDEATEKVQTVHTRRRPFTEPLHRLLGKKAPCSCWLIPVWDRSRWAAVLVFL